MDRRKFLSLIGAISVAPAIPLPTARAGAVAAASYNRFTYGLAVFHARTRTSLSVADLTARLRVTAVQAEALIGEMTAKGVVTPALDAAAGAVRAVNSFSQTRPTPGKALRKAREWLADQKESTDTSPEDRAPDTDAVPTLDRRDSDPEITPDTAPVKAPSEAPLTPRSAVPRSPRAPDPR